MTQVNNLANIADSTYADLPPIGGKDNGWMVSLGQQLGTESSVARGPWIQYLNESQSLYLTGRPDGAVFDALATFPQRQTINRIQGTINTFTALATRTPSTHTIKSASVNEDGPWILTKPFTLPAPPQQDPNAPPPQPVTLPLYQPLDEAVVDQVPPGKRICIDTETVVAYLQTNYDIKRRQSRMDATIREMIHNKQMNGWVMGLFGWDPTTQLSTFDIYEPQQWLPDSIKYDVDKMNYVRLDMVVDAEEAKRRYPAIAKTIDQFAAKSTQYEPGFTQYAYKYTATAWARPVITLCHIWLRNQEAPMTLAEGLDTGMVVQQEANDETGQTQTADATGVSPQPPSDESQESPGMEPDTGGSEIQPRNEPTGLPRLIHARTGADLTASFDPQGNPAAKFHADHPHKLVIRHWIQICGTVAPGSDVICPQWDIPVWLDKNIPVQGRPWGSPETERLLSPQNTLNNLWTAANDHVGFFRAPTGFVTADIVSKIKPPFVNGSMEPGKVYVVDNVSAGADGTIKLSDHIFNIDPPPMPPAIPQLKKDASDEYELVAGNPGVNNGTPPPGVDSGVAIANLQSQSQVSQGFKSMYSEEAIYRMAMLKLFAEIHFQSVDEFMRCNRSVPRVIVEGFIIPYARSMILDMDISLATGGGQVKAQKDAQTRQDFASEGGGGVPLIDAETAREKLDYDSPEIDRRLKNQREEMAEEQAKAQQMAAPPPPPPMAKEPISPMTVNFSDLPPSAKNAALQQMGFPPAPMEELQPPAPKVPMNGRPIGGGRLAP